MYLWGRYVDESNAAPSPLIVERGKNGLRRLQLAWKQSGEWILQAIQIGGWIFSLVLV